MSDEHQAFERDWWGDCANTFGEEAKQISYAHRMGLVNVPEGGHWPSYDLSGKSVLDVGGGPASMLLKCRNRGRSLVVDPCAYPLWTTVRYAALGIEVLRQRAEDPMPGGFDEVWMYNVLQHVEDPEAVVRNIRASGKVARIFEWIEIPASIGHPHVLHADDLNAWFGGVGTTEDLDENGAVGRAWYGVFGE